MHALIIEDQHLVASLIEEGLRELGYTSFHIASREHDAIAAAEEQCPDLITADNRLTDGSGIRAVQEICELRTIPVVFIAGDETEIRKLIPEAVVLPKPFLGNQLKEAVGDALVQVKRRRAA